MDRAALLGILLFAATPAARAGPVVPQANLVIRVVVVRPVAVAVPAPLRSAPRGGGAHVTPARAHEVVFVDGAPSGVALPGRDAAERGDPHRGAQALPRAAGAE